MRKTIHEVYHHGNDRREQDMTEAEFIAHFGMEVSRHGIEFYAGEYPNGADVSIRRGNPNGGELVLDHLEIAGRLEYGWSTYTLNEEV